MNTRIEWYSRGRERCSICDALVGISGGDMPVIRDRACICLGFAVVIVR